MSAGAVPAWLAALRARAAQPPRRPRVPLHAAGAVVGSVEPDFLSVFEGLVGADGGPLLHRGPEGWHLRAAGSDFTHGLGLLAHAMRAAGVAAAWRDEQLAVADAAGRVHGTIERGAVRPLGIVTHAVHLVGFAPDGRVWVQQRAWDKPNDPGLWDTLMGGMVPASDSLAEALARETWEEAGLRVEQLRNLAQRGRVTIRRPAQDGQGAGYGIEHIDWFSATVPEGVVPENQDGEVAQFALRGAAEVLADVQQDVYTLEAALILAEALPVGA